MLLTQKLCEQLNPLPWFIRWKDAVSIRPDVQFTPSSGERRVTTHFNIHSGESFGEFTALEFAVCGALIDYVQLTQLDASALIPMRPNANRSAIICRWMARRDVTLS